MKESLFLILLLIFSGCATKKLEEHSHQEVTHFILGMAMTGPAIQNAIGSFENDALKEMSQNLTREDFKTISMISSESFHPLNAYKAIHTRSIQTIGKDDAMSLARRLDSDVYRRFSEKLLELYKEGGYKKVTQAMRDLDEEKMDLDMDKAYIAEKISRTSLNFNVVRILFSKMPQGSPAEELLYRQSMFALTYLALEDFSEEEVEKILEIRQNPIWLKYQQTFERAISDSYDQFFFKLQRYIESKMAG